MEEKPLVKLFKGSVEEAVKEAKKLTDPELAAKLANNKNAEEVKKLVKARLEGIKIVKK